MVMDQEIRDLLERLRWEEEQSLSAKAIIELAVIINDRGKIKSLLAIAKRALKYYANTDTYYYANNRLIGEKESKIAREALEQMEKI